MEYTVNKLSKLANISTRTLRYYDEIGLLKPARVNSSGYRIYGEFEVDKLQQILFFRELGMPLENIRDIMDNPNFDREKALDKHLTALLAKREQINQLINNVMKTIGAMRGEIEMADKEKFEGFKQKLIDDNEENYGAEIRKKYGRKAVEASNSKIKGMSEEQYNDMEELTKVLNATLKEAFNTGNPKGELAQKACSLHKQWLLHFWTEDMYSKETHKALVQGYVDDPRFTAYYDKIAIGCASFLRDAINYYYEE